MRTVRFLFDRSLYGDLCRVAYASTRDFMRERAPLLARQGKAVPAMVVSPQSFSDLLVPHAHAHAAVSLGLFRKDGVYFPMEDLDFSGLEELFRERFFEMLLRREKILPETVEKFMSWDHSGFSVGWKERRIEADDRKNLEGLLTYMERPAVSLRRLRYREDGMVHYQGTRFHPRLGIDHQLLHPVDFLALLVPHVALKYEITLRLYGALSTTFRRKAGWIQKPPVHEPPPEPIFLSAAAAISQPDPAPPSIVTPPAGSSPPPGASPEEKEEEDSPFLRKRKRSWATLISKAWLDDPSICRSCGQQMKIIAAIAREQEDVIERILRHLHLWDPPWKRPRKVRGSPPSSADGSAPSPAKAQRFERRCAETFEAEAVDPIFDDELYAVDPVPPDDDAPT